MAQLIGQSGRDHGLPRVWFGTSEFIEEFFYIRIKVPGCLDVIFNTPPQTSDLAGVPLLLVGVLPSVLEVAL